MKEAGSAFKSGTVKILANFTKELCVSISRTASLLSIRKHYHIFLRDTRFRDTILLVETEVEAKFLDINPHELRGKLRNMRAVQEYPERLMKRKTFDDQDRKLRKVGGWVRLRDEGDKITLSYKQLDDRTLHGTKEVTVTVDNFNTASLFLESVGFKQKSFQETKREKWTLGYAEITIDTWPWIPSFVEIEANDEKTIKDISAKLGFDWARALHGSVETAYQHYYDVTEEEIDGWKSITFIPVPDWLEKKRKK